MSVLVTLDGTVRDPDQPLLFGDDLAAVRGDGVFETLLIRGGAACLVESHLSRLVRSAALMDLPIPDISAWRRAVDIAVSQWSAQSSDDGVLRLVYSRGRECGTGPTAYLTVNEVPPRVRVSRRDGVSVVLLERGLPSVGAAAMPWLLAGAKTLSYAVNMAALREAARRGADEVIFVSSDGLILEGPRSTVVIATTGQSGRPALLTPPPWYPILSGTTQQSLFDVARANGYDCDYRALRPADLFTARGVWLVSSITLGAWVHTVDGQAMPPTPLRAEVAALIDGAIAGGR